MAHRVGYEHKILCLGSCFAANMGKLLAEHFFQVQCNPNGIIFNPMSLLQGMQQALNPNLFDPEKHLLAHQGNYYSALHHGSFKSDSKEALIARIHAQNKLFGQYLQEADYVLLTWGSAQVYTWQSSQQLVANCHKLPAHLFEKRLLTVSEISSAYEIFITELLRINPKLNIIWSISPVKYIRGGLHENNLSKSTLLLALETLLKKFPQSYYFPAFEILQDELRDYRFYAADMAHPSEQAIQYIWEQFREHLFSEEAKALYEQVQPISQAMGHRFLTANSSEQAAFKSKQLALVQALQAKYPQLSLASALSHFSQ